MAERVKCLECDNLILPDTAKRNGGLCAPCSQQTPEMRAEKRENERRLATGTVFRPSDEELASASVPPGLAAGPWSLQPEFYDDGRFESVAAAVAAARSEAKVHVFLVTEGGGQLNVGFSERFGVCEFQNTESGEFCCAYTDVNLREQVPTDLHVVQACPCCGVGMLWYPSRFHMPREQALTILENAIAGRETPGVAWLTVDDFSYTGQGRG